MNVETITNQGQIAAAKALRTMQTEGQLSSGFLLRLADAEPRKHVRKAMSSCAKKLGYESLEDLIKTENFANLGMGESAPLELEMSFFEDDEPEEGRPGTPLAEAVEDMIDAGNRDDDEGEAAAAAVVEEIATEQRRVVTADRKERAISEEDKAALIELNDKFVGVVFGDEEEEQGPGNARQVLKDEDVADLDMSTKSGWLAARGRASEIIAEADKPKARTKTQRPDMKKIDWEAAPVVISVPETCTCPRCAVPATGIDAIREIFGTRKTKNWSTVEGARRTEIAQSYCRACRSENAKETRAKKAAEQAAKEAADAAAGGGAV